MLTIALVTLLVFDTLRLWRRAQALPVLPKTEGGVIDEEFQIIYAPGVAPPEGFDLKGRAARWADEEGLLVVDILPEQLPTPVALALLQQRHPVDYSQQPFLSGMSAGFAFLIHEEILQAAGPPPEGGESPYLDWLQYTQKLKRYAPWQSALAVASGWRQLHPFSASAPRRRAQQRRLYGAGLFRGAKLSPILWALLAYAATDQLLSGLALIGLYCAQPALILAAGPLRSRALVFSLLRPLFELRAWGKLLGETDVDPHDPPAPESLRGEYEEALNQGTERFFQSRRSDCPLCGGDLRERVLSLPDFYQGKPGTFYLDECRKCGHRFQNPQLSLEGLSFYYRDFYDRLGEAGMDLVFGASERSYRQRLNLIRASGTPRRWLDVGGGHGHFTLLGRHLLPQTRFDLLDLSESVEIAARRGWTARGIRGLFVEERVALAGQYDGISMSHYLEHTPDPIAELKAASEVLDEGGLLLIELPDPDSRIGALLGSYWLPWFQPQHLHFLSRVNLSKQLREANFQPLSWEVGPAHQSVDLFFATIILLNKIAPDPSRPWSKGGAAAGLWRGLASLLMLPLILSAVLLDRLLRPLLARDGWSNTYRVIAKRERSSEPAASS